MSQPTKYGCCSSGCALMVAALVAFGVAVGYQGARRTASPSQPAPAAVATAEPPAVLPELQTFLDEHREFGDAKAVETAPDWAKGPRRRIRFKGGRSLVFYMKGGRVVTVYEEGPDGGRAVLWGGTEKD